MLQDSKKGHERCKYKVGPLISKSLQRILGGIDGYLCSATGSSIKGLSREMHSSAGLTIQLFYTSHTFTGEIHQNPQPPCQLCPPLNPRFSSPLPPSPSLLGPFSVQYPLHLSLEINSYLIPVLSPTSPIPSEEPIPSEDLMSSTTTTT